MISKLQHIYSSQDVHQSATKTAAIWSMWCVLAYVALTNRAFKRTHDPALLLRALPLTSDITYLAEGTGTCGGGKPFFKFAACCSEYNNLSGLADPFSPLAVGSPKLQALHHKTRQAVRCNSLNQQNGAPTPPCAYLGKRDTA
jgi:hypothetical protein